MISQSKKKITKNYIYNSVYQLFTMIIPLVTTPYISRVLLAEGVGKYSFTYSIVNYFILAAQLGFGYYAQREIAKYQGNKHQQSIIFFEILVDKGISVGLSSVVYACLCLLNIFGSYTTLMWWWLILLIAQFFDVAFIFQGNEDFAKIVLRNFFIKILGIVLIFIFVRTEKDVWIYILSIAGSNLLGILSTWPYLMQYIEKIEISELHPARHWKATLKLFIPTIASVLYAYLDKTLIGLLIKETYEDNQVIIQNGVCQVITVTKNYADLENGYYEQAEKIVKVGMSLITALGVVMLPRNTKEYSDGNVEILKNNIYMAARFVFAIGIPIMFGLIGISNNLVPWFLGDNFIKSSIYLKMFTPLVILFGLENVFGIQYLVTTGQDGKYSVSIVSGTVINLVLNIVLIPFFWGYGAIVASVISETIIVFMMYYCTRKAISFVRILKDSWKYIIAGIAMFIAVYTTQTFLSANIIHTVLLILEGVVVYLFVVILLKDEMIISLSRYIKK